MLKLRPDSGSMSLQLQQDWIRFCKWLEHFWVSKITTYVGYAFINFSLCKFLVILGLFVSLSILINLQVTEWPSNRLHSFHISMDDKNLLKQKL